MGFLSLKFLVLITAFLAPAARKSEIPPIPTPSAPITTGSIGGSGGAIDADSCPVSGELREFRINTAAGAWTSGTPSRSTE
jgi:hypothetical protein